MKIRVDKLTFKEFKEYTDSTFIKSIKMSLSLFSGIAILIMMIGFALNLSKDLMQPIFWCVGIFLFLIIISNSAISVAYKKSGLETTACRYILEDDGLDIKMGKLKGTLEWKYVKKIKETKNLYIMLLPGSHLILPKHTLNEEEFLSVIAKNMEEKRIVRLRYKKDRE